MLVKGSAFRLMSGLIRAGCNHYFYTRLACLWPALFNYLFCDRRECDYDVYEYKKFPYVSLCTFYSEKNFDTDVYYCTEVGSSSAN